MKRIHNQQGFTLIELIMVIAILGILSVVALPEFTDLVADAENAQVEGVVAGLRSGIVSVYADNVVANAGNTFPTSITGSAGVCNSGNPCAGNILQYPLDDGNWTLGGTATAPTLTHSNGTVCTYNADGTDANFGQLTCA